MASNKTRGVATVVLLLALATTGFSCNINEGKAAGKILIGTGGSAGICYGTGMCASSK